MTAAMYLAFAGVALCLIDFALAMATGRCCVPGLKCAACRRKP